jgi:hypothetical protein
VIVTRNLKDFPSDRLNIYQIEAQDPDEFVLNLIDLKPRAVLDAVQRQAARLKNPRHRVDDVLHTLERNGLSQSVAMLKGL